MKNGDWEKAKEIFGDAIKFAPDERLRFLDEVCADDTDTRREVESLLASYDDAESFMEKPAVGAVAEIIKQPKNPERGKCFGHYEIIEQIGAGGMGEVYLANDKKLDRQVAVKILNEKFSRDESNLNRFIQEAKAASALNHPNILVIHEIGEAGDVHFIVSEFIKGKTLREIVRTACGSGRVINANNPPATAGGSDSYTLKLSEVLDISIQIANALCTAHEAHLVHRDIKPENIMIRPDGFVKILDFGLAKLVEQKSIGFEDVTVRQNQTAKGVIMGTVNYMSPEQAKGERVDERTDIFSFGVVIYEMTAGRTPFAGDSMSETFANLINSEPQPLLRYAANVPDELQRIVAKTLRKNKDERYQTIKDLQIDLKNLQKRLEFETELERNQPPNRNTKEAQTLKIAVEIENQNLPPNNLTENLSMLIGREKEIASIGNLLRREDVQLVTMIGIGGTGKTRLSQAVAERMLKEFADGVFFIELGAITDSQFVASTIALPLGVKESGGKSFVEILKNYLRGKKMLLVVDNFEQVLSAAPIIAELLNAAPRLKILITSREPLHLSMEHEFVVPPLEVPSGNSSVTVKDLRKCEAVRLFVKRAQIVKPKFALTNENAEIVAEICVRLDGLPLAIELAAARVKVLSPQAILSKLENRLQLLTGGARDLPVKQQTMRGAVEWSYNLLTEDEKRVFRSLSVFAGGFTVEAAAAIVKYDAGKKPETSNSQLEITKDRISMAQIDVLDEITSLVDKSLLVANEQADGETRFRMLEVVREYALECLEKNNESKATHRRHAAYFLALGEEAEPHLTGAESVKWLDRLEDEHDNLRDALAWLLENDAKTAARLAAAIRAFWTNHCHLTEGRKWLEAALECGCQNAPAAVLFKLLNGLGLAARQQGDYSMARKVYEEGLAAGRAANDLRQIAQSSKGLGMVAYQQGDFTLARKYIEEGLTIDRKLGDKLGIALSLNILGELLRADGDDAAARPLFEESLAIRKQLDNKEGISGTLNNLGAIAYGEGDFAAARLHYAEALTMAQELGEKIILSFSLDGFAALAAGSGKSKNAVKLAGATEHLREQIGYKGIEHADRRFRDAYLAELKTKMDEAAFAELYEQGRKLKSEEAVALCLEKTGDEAKIERLQTFKAENATAILQATTDNANLQTAETNNSFARQIRRHKPLAAVALVVLLAAIGLGVWRFTDFSANTQIESIAVLPFENQNPETEYLSDGLTESVINNLTNLPNLRVISRNSVFRYKGKETEPSTVGQELNVRAVLTGRFIQRGDDLIISAELTDLRENKQIWGQQYNRKVIDAFALQQEISRDISKTLRKQLTGEQQQRLAKRETESPEAFQFYLKGRYHWNKRTGEDFEKALEFFNQAIERDPTYAPAYVGLAESYLLGNYKNLSQPEKIAKAQAAANKAVEIDEQLGEAHTTLGYIKLFEEWDWASADREYRRAVELSPNYATAHHRYGKFLATEGRFDESFAEYNRALELDPLSFAISTDLGLTYYYARQYDRAIEHLKKLKKLNPNFGQTYFHLAKVYQKKEMYEEAIAEFDKGFALGGGDLQKLAKRREIFENALRTSGVKAYWQKVLEDNVADGNPDSMTMVKIYVGTGEYNKAFEFLEKAYQERNGSLVWLKISPEFDDIRSDPRFQDLLRRMGLPQ